MQRESMGGEGVQVSETSKSFPPPTHQQQSVPNSSSMASSASASSPASSSSSSAGPVIGTSSAGASYSSMHYSSAASSSSSVGSNDDSQRGSVNNSRNSNNSNAGSSGGVSGNLDAQQQQQQQQHQQQAHYQNQIMNAASVMNSGAMNQVTCLVCYNAQVDVMLEPCHHQFHAHCIDRWLNKDKVCPICWIPIQNQRRIMPAQYAHHPQAVQSGSLPANVPRGNYAGNSSIVNKTLGDSNTGGSVNVNMAPNNGALATASNDGSALAGVANMNSNELPNPATMRKGKWTAEESSYCDRLIEEFKKGNLPLAEGTTLRTFLSKLLNCDPMRISKKYTGDQCIGKVRTGSERSF